MTDRPWVLFVVDDDPAARMIVSHEIEDSGCRVREFADAQSCLAALAQGPDVLLLDVEMPGMDGISLCREIRAAGLDAAQVIFLSGHDDLDTRLRAYDAGGDDFMVKPCAPEELLRKVRRAQRVLEEKQGLSSQAGYARQAAFTAMSSMGEMGALLEFMRQSFACATPDALAQALFHALGQYGLQGLLELRGDVTPTCHSSQGACSALENSILGHTRTMQRLFQFHDRLAINYPHITLLAMGLPLDDADRVGRLRDHLAILVEAADARLAAMASDSRRLAQSAGIGDAVAELTYALAEVEDRQAVNRLRSLEATNAYLEELERAFVHLGLSESQESELVDMARRAVARITDVLGEDKSLGDRLRVIASRLRELGGEAG